MHYFGPVTVIQGSCLQNEAVVQQPEADLLLATEYDIQVLRELKAVRCEIEQAGDLPYISNIMFIAGPRPVVAA